MRPTIPPRGTSGLRRSERPSHHGRGLRLQRRVLPHALRAAGVGRVIDVRQRRGVRGTEYAWANSKRLQAALAEAKVEYEHRPELAPTTELRRLQYAEDARRGEGKRSRSELAAEYVRRYTDEILERVGVEELARSL